MAGHASRRAGSAARIENCPGIEELNCTNAHLNHVLQTFCWSGLDPCYLASLIQAHATVMAVYCKKDTVKGGMHKP